MGKIKNEVWEGLLGFVPGREMKEMILLAVEQEHKTIEEICSRYVLPEIVILEADGTTWSRKHQRYVTVAELEQEHPLGKFAKFIVIGANSDIEAHRKLSNK